MLEGRKERAGEKRERETEENKKTAWRKEAKELGSPGQDDSSKERRRGSSSGLGETFAVFARGTTEAQQASTHQLETAFADNNEDPQRVA